MNENRMLRAILYAQQSALQMHHSEDIMRVEFFDCGTIDDAETVSFRILVGNTQMIKFMHIAASDLRLLYVVSGNQERSESMNRILESLGIPGALSVMIDIRNNGVIRINRSMIKIGNGIATYFDIPEKIGLIILNRIICIPDIGKYLFLSFDSDIYDSDSTSETDSSDSSFFL